MLFTDIEASSDGGRTLGADKWEAVLEHHAGIVREALGKHGGFEVRSEGDSFFVVFTSPSAALTAAAAMQRGLNAADWPHQTSVRVRMGVHTGEARPVGWTTSASRSVAPHVSPLRPTAVRSWSQTRLSRSSATCSPPD